MLRPYARLLDGDLSYPHQQAQRIPDPIAVGAVGGSGTRVLATILAGAGVAMATSFNASHDALQWPPMKKLLSAEMLARFDRDELLRNAFGGLDELLYRRRRRLGLEGPAGWKIPATHLWLGELQAFFPGLRYVHLMRHGLDMAYSDNQNQWRDWAPLLGLPAPADDAPAQPSAALEFWLRANRRALDTMASLPAGSCLLVRFEALCEAPEAEIARLLRFLQLAHSEASVAALASQVKTPGSLYRYRRRDWRADFSADQLDRLAGMGYAAD